MALFGNEELNWTVVAGTSGSGNAGTTVIKVGKGSLGSIYVGVPSTGTVSYYDAGTAGTSAASLMFIITNNGTKVPDLFAPMCRFQNGLIAVSSVGTTNQTVFWN